MQNKLTLSIEANVIEEAKKYAKEQGRSLSNIVEEYLRSVSNKPIEKRKPEIDSLIKELWGSVKLPKDMSYRQLLEEALVDKYIK